MNLAGVFIQMFVPCAPPCPSHRVLAELTAQGTSLCTG